ncbi:MAG: Nramp family divalent metal transporter [Kiritimatiellia bacterium]|jgi:Mn2+/Fe2+ NRAMP family transporter|nr:Nramp family divalent metal transporter [Kiritimatiellia bacterium]
MAAERKTNRPSLLAVILPGFLVAATGVGAGDLATASFTGSQLGLAVLWAVVVGGLLKFVLTEGLARWQLVTGETLLEGVAHHFGRIAGVLFLPYLFLWSFFVGSALMSACGTTLHAMIPLFDEAANGKLFFGISSSLVGLFLVLAGGFKLFEKVMGVSIVIMFAIVVVTALMLWPGTTAVLSGLMIPSIPDAGGTGVTWTVALIGGVGGTLTMLCYGYWIREKGRTGTEAINLCRIDLAIGYSMTILFGIAMVIIGSTVEIEGRGARLLIILAERLEEPLGLTGRWLFLIGAFCAIFSSLLGVWQAVPYLFADIWGLFIRRTDSAVTGDITKSVPYRVYLFAIAFLPMLGLLMSFKEVQKLYAVIGSLFVPLLAVGLLILNGKRAWMKDFVNRPLTIVVLFATVGFFALMACMKYMG